MKFRLYEDKMVLGAGRLLTFIEQGEYPIIRWFDSHRVLVDVARFPKDDNSRRLTVLSLEDGEVINDDL